MRPFLRHEPAPPPVVGRLPPFELTDEKGRVFGNAQLAGRVHVVNFIFTRCASICPLLTHSMGQLQRRYDEQNIDGIRLLSITVDPEYDTPERLAAYGKQHGADPERWSFVTGDPQAVTSLVVDGFKAARGQPEENEAGLFDIAHGGKFVIVDGNGGIRGYYDTDEMGLDEIFHRSRHVLKQQDR